jgi:hypothetical protein
MTRMERRDCLTFRMAYVPPWHSQVLHLSRLWWRSLCGWRRERPRESQRRKELRILTSV